MWKRTGCAASSPLHRFGERRDPFFLGQIVGDLDALRTPCELREPRRLDHEVAFALAEFDQLHPIVDRQAARLEAVDDRLRRERTRVDHPGLREDLRDPRERVFPEFALPELGEHRMVEERERQLLFEVGLRRRRHLDAIMARRVEEQFLLGHVEQIEHLEVAIDDVEFLFAPVFETHEERFFGEDDVLGRAHVGIEQTALTQGLGEPAEFGPVVGGFFGDDDRDDRLLFAALRAHRGGEAFGDAVRPADRLHAEIAVRLGHRADEAHAARDAIEFGRGEAGVGHDQVGPDDGGDILFEPVLARQPHDVLGLAAIEILGDEGGRGPACAAIVETIEGPVEGGQIAPDDFELLDRLGVEGEQFGADAPGDLVFRVLDLEEAGQDRIVEEARAPRAKVGSCKPYRPWFSSLDSPLDSRGSSRSQRLYSVAACDP